jgi:enoyl-CoA hydratase/carnithine racemase
MRTAEAIGAELRNFRVETASGVATLLLDEPGERVNTVNPEAMLEFVRLLERLERDEAVRAIVLASGKPDVFVAGAKIEMMQTVSDAAAAERLARDGQAVFDSVERFRKPIVAAIHGACLGGGLELALACHLRIASSRARFGLPEVKLGIIPGYGGTIRLPRLVGRGRALELILTGEMIDAQEAFRIGLVNRVEEPDQLLAATRALLDRILANGPVALAAALESVDHAVVATSEQAQLLESNLFGLLASTTDMREGMAAFLERRAAAFEGR